MSLAQHPGCRIGRCPAVVAHDVVRSFDFDCPLSVSRHGGPTFSQTPAVLTYGNPLKNPKSDDLRSI